MFVKDAARSHGRPEGSRSAERDRRRRRVGEPILLASAQAIGGKIGGTARPGGILAGMAHLDGLSRQSLVAFGTRKE